MWVELDESLSYGKAAVCFNNTDTLICEYAGNENKPEEWNIVIKDQIRSRIIGFYENEEKAKLVYNMLLNALVYKDIFYVKMPPSDFTKVTFKDTIGTRTLNIDELKELVKEFEGTYEEN